MYMNSLFCISFSAALLVKDWSCAILIRVSSRDTGKTMVDASLGEIMTTCEKITWLLSEGEKWLKPEYRYLLPSFFLFFCFFIYFLSFLNLFFIISLYCIRRHDDSLEICLKIYLPHCISDDFLFKWLAHII